MSDKPFELFPEAPPHNAAMNAWMVSEARRGEHATGAVARLSGADPKEAIRDRLSTALTHSENARRRGDIEEHEYQESLITQLIEESRASRGADGRDPPTGRFTSETPPGFDGGFRGPRGPRPNPAGGHETANQLFAAMLHRSRTEAAERGEERVVQTNT
jgi:hypothetical protein